MIRLFALACAAVVLAVPAFADDKPTDAEAEKVKAVVANWGCEGGRIEKESEGTGVFEVDDAKCKDGKQYDFRLDKDFNLLVIVND